MKNIDLNELKKIQLDILDVIHNFCISNNIQYSLACGSMLGAVRHKGYIPWDDDIDIYLIRDEYEKLMKIFPTELHNISVESLERNSKWDRAYAKAYDVRTEIHEGEERDLDYAVDIGVGIDIFPIDAVPASEKKWISYNKRRKLLIWMQIMKFAVVRPGRSFLKNAILFVMKLILFPISSRCMAEIVDRYARKFNGKETVFVFENAQGIRLKRRFRKDFLLNTRLYPFEDRMYMGISEFDDYLKNSYGDYMKLPPEEKRQTHHHFRAWWKDGQ